MKQADRIRAFVVASIIAPARRRGLKDVSIRAGDVHKDMGLSNALPAVYAALGSNKFLKIAGVVALERSGPSNGANALLRFALSAAPIATASSHVIPERKSSGTGHPPHSGDPVKCNLRNALALVSCVKSKRAHPAPARDLYISPLFTMARDLIEAQGAEWRILSALYGLVEPPAIIDPYDYTLKRLGVTERRAWANKVLLDLLPLLGTIDRVVFFAGERYREFLAEPLKRLGIAVEVPMQGLRQGEQLAWLSNQS